MGHTLNKNVHTLQIMIIPIVTETIVEFLLSCTVDTHWKSYYLFITQFDNFLKWKKYTCPKIQLFKSWEINLIHLRQIKTQVHRMAYKWLFLSVLFKLGRWELNQVLWLLGR
jgi:hypothetical protein